MEENMTYRMIRPLCYAIGITLTAVLAISAASGSAAKKPAKPQYEWTVTITDDDPSRPPFQLQSDGLQSDGEDPGTYTDTGNVQVRVEKEKRPGHYRFHLRIENDPSGRKIKLQNVELSPAAIDENSEGPGWFPADGCFFPDGFCTDECTLRLRNFLNGDHPPCEYSHVHLRIDVSVDIENMPADGTLIPLESNDYMHFLIYNTNMPLNDPADAFHNMGAVNRYNPLSIARTGENEWVIRADIQDHYMNYGEFYYYNDSPTEKRVIMTQEWPMTANGPFSFETTWRRSPAGN